ncbi:hypothetical protein B0A48_02765 [Cryoendolithus antarcticus]|uniref:Haloacid dehalogenase, type II n=1 Tax=Cryoendolithus antarcticus TaxID=1507870 RepID=A0A1V8TL84_9PEZI|nr:hypothetical protein B0A48_02765 [Cryoendolithus antarcticus]
MASSDTINWQEVKALSFDIYGTLVDWESGIYSAASASALGPYLPSRKETLGRLDEHDRAVQREHPTMLQRDVIAEGLRRYASELEVVKDGKLTQVLVDETAKTYGSAIGSYPAFEDTVAAIQSLGNRFKLIPLSNVDKQSFSQTLAGPLKRCRFDAIYTAEDIGSYTPDLRNFHYLLEHMKQDLGVEKGELVHVAQSLLHDHGPAKEMGITGVWVDRGGRIGGEDLGGQERFGWKLKVMTLGELAGIVEEAFARA